MSSMRYQISTPLEGSVISSCYLVRILTTLRTSARGLDDESPSKQMQSADPLSCVLETIF